MDFIKKTKRSILFKFTGTIFGLLIIFFTLFLCNIKYTEYNLLKSIYQKRKDFIALKSRETAKRALENRLSLIKTTLGKHQNDLTYALFTVDRGKCREIISYLAPFPSIKGVILYDLLANKPFLIANKKPNETFLFSGKNIRCDNLPSLPISLQEKNGKEIGYLKIFYDPAWVTQEVHKLKQESLAALDRDSKFAQDMLRNSLKLQIVSLFLIFAALYITFYLLFSKFIYKPIRQLEHNLKLFFDTLTGKTARIDDQLQEIRSEDEFGRMGRFINNGISVGSKIHQELAEHTQELSRLATVLEQSAQSIIITDLEGKIEYVNPAFEEITGYRFTEVKGKKPAFLQSGQHSDSFYQELWQKISTGQNWEGVFTNRKKDGSLYYERSIIFPVKDQAGNIINFAAAKQDITKERELEHQLRQTQKMDSIGLLAGGIAHDFNNQLTIINGYTELAFQNIDPDNPLYNDLETILEAGQKAQNLTSQLLAFSRRQPHTPKIVDLNQTLTAMGKMIRRLIGEDITIQTRLTENLPHILADTSQIEQILINLVVNARDALLAVKDNGRQKTITIETRSALAETDLSANFLPCTDQQPSHRQYIEFSVADNGIGMDETTQQRIFEPFFTTKEKFKGTGLGLSIIYGIVKQNNGIIQIRSALGQGTTFYIYWPVAKKQEKELTHKYHPPKNRQGNETILLIEDEKAVRQFSKKTLASLGYTVYTAENGQVAIKQLQQGLQVDLIITDIIMPVMNGWEFTIEAKKIYPEQKIIYLSGYAEDYLSEARPSGDKTTDNNKMAGNMIAGDEIELISKPFSIGELVTAVRKVLDEISS